jgi:hypothetical protein
VRTVYKNLVSTVIAGVTCFLSEWTNNANLGMNLRIAFEAEWQQVE